MQRTETPAPTETPAGPTEAPSEEQTEVSTDPTAEPTTEPSADPTTEPTAEPTAEPTPVPFTAEVKIELVNKGDIYFGDEVTLKVIVENATAPYAIRWEANDGSGWKTIEGEDEDEYKFIVTEENADTEYRVVLLANA